MADITDPIAAAMQARLAAIPQAGEPSSTYGDQQLAANLQQFGGGGGNGAMGGSVVVSGGMDNPYAPSTTALYGYNPDTGQLVVNSQRLPNDFRLWTQAAALPSDQIRPMSVAKLRDAGFMPLDQSRVQAMVKLWDENAESNVMGNAAHGLRRSFQTVVGGLARELPRVAPYAPGIAPVFQLADAGSVAAGTGRLEDIGAGMSESIGRTMQQQAEEHRLGQSMPEQAYGEATFGTHPGRATVNLASTALPETALPLALSIAGGPAGAAVGFGAMGSQANADAAGQRFLAATAHMTPDQMTSANPQYAALRAQGLSHDQSVDALYAQAQRVAGDVGGATGAALAPLYGRIPLAAMRMAPALAPAMGGRGLGGFIGRRLGMTALTGVENAALTVAQNAPPQIAADVATGRGVQPMGEYMGGSGEAGVLGAAFGALTRAPARSPAVWSQPGAMRAETDVGAAAAGIPGRPVDQNAPQPAGMPPMPLPNVQGVAPGGMPNVPGSAARPLPQVGEVADMLGGQARPPEVPPGGGEPPAAAPPFNPEQGSLPGVTPVGPQLPQPRPGLIAQRAQEQAAAANAVPPEGPAGALPPPGTTEGQRGMLSSAQQSLAMVENLLASGQFNKRTKTGKATIAQLTAERDRLQAEVDALQNAQLGEEMGAAREARPAQPPASLVEDAAGQRGLPGIEPVSAPDGAPPANMEPPPIGQDQPMSAAEAESRLRMQRARNPENRAPQEDLFPRELRQGLQDRIASLDKEVPATTPEPAMDLAAQMDALKTGARDAVFVAAGNEAQVPPVPRGARVRTIKRAEGTLYTTNPAKAKAYKGATALDDNFLARLQDLPQTKSAALRAGDSTVTQALDANGAVVKEALGKGNAEAVAAAAPAEGSVRQLSAEDAQARRAELNAKFDRGDAMSPDELRALVGETRSERDTGRPGQSPLEGMLNGHAGPKAAAEAGHKGFFYTDLNGFKAINDAAGHAVGDKLLQEFGSLYRDVAKRHGGISWLAGGDEFVSSFPTQAAARKAHAELQSLAGKHVVEFTAADGTTHRIEGVGFSGGVGKNVEAADAANAAAKRAHYAASGTERRGAVGSRRAQEPVAGAARRTDEGSGRKGGQRESVPEPAPREVAPTKSAQLKAKAAAKRPQVPETPAPTKSAKLKAKAAAKREAAAEAALVDDVVGKKKVSPEEIDGSQRAGAKAVDAATRALREDVAANHPQMLDRFDKLENARGREPDSPLITVPLTQRELGIVGERMKATAQAEQASIDAGTWVPRQSVTARLLDAAGLSLQGAKLRDAIRSVAEATPAQLKAFMDMAAGRLADSTLAKGVARGMDVVRAAAKDAPVVAEGNAMAVGAAKAAPARRAKPVEKNEAFSGDRVTMYGDVAPAAGRAIRHWVGVVEKSAGKFLPDELHVMSPAEVKAKYGVDVPSEGWSGKITDAAGKVDHVIAIDMKALGDGPAAVEALAHEFAHQVIDHVFDSLPVADKTAVRNAYNDWLRARGGGTPRESMISRLPPALADLVRASNAKPERAYAESWKEWVSDEVAKWMLTDARPRTAIDRFFAKLADAFQKLYAHVTGRGRPTDAVATMMDNLVERSMNLRAQDAQVRANEMHYAREPADAGPAPELARRRIDLRAARERADRIVSGAKTLGEDIGKVANGDVHAVHDRLNKAWSRLAEGAPGDIGRKIAFGVMSMRDVVDRYRKRGEFGGHLVAWDDAMRLAEKFSREVQQRANIASERAHRLSAPVRRALNQLMYKTTTYAIHPDEGFGVGRNAHLLSDDQTTTDSNRARYNEVRQLWDQMRGVEGDPQHVYKELAGALSDIHRELFTARHANIDRLQLSEAAKAEAHALLSEKEASITRGPYFPLTREGNYVTTVTMPQTRVGEYTTRAEANRIKARQKALNPHAEVMVSKTPEGTWDVHIGEKAVYFHPTQRDAKLDQPAILQEMREAWSHMGVDFDAAKAELGDTLIEGPFHKQDFYRKMEVPTLNKFTKELNDLATEGKIDPEVYKAFSEMVIEALPETSTRKSELHRRNIRGASQDMLGGYVRHVAGVSHSFGKTKVARDVNEAWAGMNKHSASRSEPELNTVMNDLRRRQETLAKRMERNWTNTTANTLQDLSSVWSLGMSPAFLMQQALQPIVVTLPVLAAWAGKDGKAINYGRAGAYLKDAYDGAIPFYTKRGTEQFVAEAKRMLGTYAGEGKTLQESATDMMQQFAKTADESELLRYANDRGTLNFDFLNAVADGSSGSKFGDKTRAILRLTMAVPQQVEAMNRMTSLLAGYRIARDLRGMDHAEAMHAADAVVAQTHGDYGRYNRPSAFNRPLLGMALQFKMYTQFIYSLLVRNFANMMDRNLPKVERQQAARTLGYVIGSHAAFGGAVGIGPIAAAAKFGLGGLMYAAAGAGLIDNKKRDQTIGDWIEENFTEWADQSLGKGAGAYLSRIAKYGAPAAANINISNKIGIPDLTDMRYTGGRQSDKPSDTMNQILITALGPVWANGQRVADGTAELLRGNAGAAGKSLLPSAPRAILGAITEAQDGVVSSSGKVLRPSTDLSPLRTFLRALGIQDAETTQMYDKRSALYDAKSRIMNERAELLQQYMSADSGGERADVMLRIGKYNRGRAKEFQISPATLKRSLSRPAMSPSDRAAARAIGQE